MAIIYGSILSPYVRKVVSVLELKNIAYELQERNPFREDHKQQLLAMHPLGKVPVYQEDNFTLADSSAICAYLEKKYPKNPAYPNEAQNYAKSLWYEEYADSQLLPAIGVLFFNTRICPKLNREPNEHGIKETLTQKLPEVFNYLDKEVSNNNYLVGNKLSIADISIVPAFLNFEFSGYTIDVNRWSNLARYVAQVGKEKPFEKILIQAKEIFSERFGQNQNSAAKQHVIS
jgi:glutathione S-transferase